LFRPDRLIFAAGWIMLIAAVLAAPPPTAGLRLAALLDFIAKASAGDAATPPAPAIILVRE